MQPTNKRTRVSRGQSKNGCFTCKARKVKCDERRPTCLRCQQANIECEGYRNRIYEEYSSSSSATTPQGRDYLSIPTVSARASPTEQEETLEPVSPRIDPARKQGLVQVGLDLLLGSYHDEHVIGQDVLKSLILRHVASSPAVNTACAALGAVAGLQEGALDPSEQLNLTFETLYGQSMRFVQREIEGSQYDRYAILACCILLTAIEVISRRRQDAEKHLRGAYQVFYSSYPQPRSTANESSIHYLGSSSLALSGAHNVVDIDVDLLLRILDVNTLSFTHCTRPPSMQPIGIELLEELIRNPHSVSLTKATINILHASLAFINTAVRFAAQNSAIEQLQAHRDQYSSLLRKLITILMTQIQRQPPGSRPTRLLILQNLCISTMIELQAIFSKYETAWDAFEGWFQRIIATAEAIIEFRHEWKVAHGHTSALGFTTQIGVIPSLYLAALKYRDGQWRRRAISCLRRADREGPWVGGILAAIAERIMNVEESTMATGVRTMADTYTRDYGLEMREVKMEQISELSRVSCVCVMEDDGVDSSASRHSASSRTTKIKTLIRRQPVSTLPALSIIFAHSSRAEVHPSYRQQRRLDANVWFEQHEYIGSSPRGRYQASISGQSGSQQH